MDAEHPARQGYPVSGWLIAIFFGFPFAPLLMLVGAAIPQTRQRLDAFGITIGTIGGYIALFVVAIIVAITTSGVEPNGYVAPPTPKLTKQEKQLAENKLCLRDANCAANRSDWKTDGFPKCFRQIEDQALFDYDWMAGVNSRFNAVELVSSYDYVKYIGSQVRFQNQYAAWQRVKYICSYDPINKAVIGVEIQAYN